MLCDAGPLIALVYGNDSDHQRCKAALSRIRTPLVTTWACITEAMHLLGNKSGAAGQDELWGYIEDGIVVIHNPSEAEQKRMRVLMKKYRDPKKNRLMDIGDASLVAAAEALKLTRIFTLDSQFSNSYRIDDKTSFELIL